MRRNPTLGDGAVVGQNTPGSQPQALGNSDLDCAKGPRCIRAGPTTRAKLEAYLRLTSLRMAALSDAAASA
jgi:hypothetical protein